MLNQGAVEQVLVDYLRNKNVYVERHKEAKTLHLLPVDREDKEEFPVIVRARSVEKCGMQSSSGFLVNEPYDSTFRANDVV